ncbi:MAG: hypothetical protein ABL977_01860, partial [Candidatus Eisenbacteria bacterium]
MRLGSSFRSFVQSAALAILVLAMSARTTTAAGPLAPLWRGGAAEIEAMPTTSPFAAEEAFTRATGAVPSGPRALAMQALPPAGDALVSLPQDAAWEGWLSPGIANISPLTQEFQGKLYLTSTVAGHVRSDGLLSWDGVKFEATPPLPGFATALGVWNNHLLAATAAAFPPGPEHPPGYRIMMLNGAVWDTLGRPSSQVNCLLEHAGNLIAGGRFTSVDGIPALGAAGFDGLAWTAMDGGFTGFTEMSTFAEHGGQLVAGGSQTALKNVFAWNDVASAWQTLGAGLNQQVTSLLSDGVTLYAAGSFTQTGTTAISKFARWDGSLWQSVTTGTFPQSLPIVLWNGGVVIARNSGPSKLSFWNGSTLSAMSDSISFGVAAGVARLGTWGTKLVVSGNFLNNGSQLGQGLLIHDGVSWTTPAEPWDDQMLSPVGGSISDMTVWDGKLVLGMSAGISAERDHYVSTFGLGVWDGQHWSMFGQGVFGQYRFFGNYQGDLVVVGGTVSIRGTTISRVARWNGTAWSGFGTGAPESGISATEYHGALYVTAESDFSYNGIARWDGTSWQNVAGGLTDAAGFGASGEGSCLYGDTLVVAGGFARAGGQPASHIAFWDGTAWHPAGAGFDQIVWSVANWNGQLVAAGNFTASGAEAMSGTAIWDGSAWHALGTNAYRTDRLVVSGGMLFAGGYFRLPDNTIIYTVARWDGTDWHLLGSGSGSALAVYDGYVYSAGAGIVHGHLSHGLSRIPLYATLDTPAPRPQGSALMLAAAPNPVRASSVLSFALPAAGHVRLSVHD